MAVEIGGGHRLDGAHGVEPVEPLGHVAGGQLLDGGLVVATLASDVFHYPRIAVNNALCLPWGQGAWAGPMYEMEGWLPERGGRDSEPADGSVALARDGKRSRTGNNRGGMCEGAAKAVRPAGGG